jgi:hypothetical protein
MQMLFPEQEGILRMATFLHRELPVRFARGVDQLDSLKLVQDIEPIREVRSWYAESFKVRRERGRFRFAPCGLWLTRTPPAGHPGLPAATDAGL